MAIEYHGSSGSAVTNVLGQKEMVNLFSLGIGYSTPDLHRLSISSYDPSSSVMYTFVILDRPRRTVELLMKSLKRFVLCVNVASVHDQYVRTFPLSVVKPDVYIYTTAVYGLCSL